MARESGFYSGFFWGFFLELVYCGQNQNACGGGNRCHCVCKYLIQAVLEVHVVLCEVCSVDDFVLC